MFSLIIRSLPSRNPLLTDASSLTVPSRISRYGVTRSCSRALHLWRAAVLGILFCLLRSAAFSQGAPAMISPPPGSVLGSSATFTWAAASGATKYSFYLGTQGAGSANLYASQSTKSTSVAVSGLPQQGVTICARLSWFRKGAWQYADFTYTEASSAPTLTVNATSISFGNVTLNTTATQSITVSSTGTAAVTVNSATVAGAGYSLSGMAFPATLNPGQNASLNVAFNPTTSGTASGSVTISSNSSTNPSVKVTLSGAGLAASYQVNLAWNAPASSPDPVAGYNIYRAASGTGAYQLVNSSPDTQTNYVDLTVKTGQSYDYEVKSVDSSGVESAASNVSTAVIP